MRFSPISSIAAGSITSSYQPLGDPFAHAMRVLHLLNNSDGDMFISFDGVTTNVIVPADTFTLYDLTSDQDSNESFRYQAGTQIYIKYATSPTTGSFYMITIYGKGE